MKIKETSVNSELELEDLLSHEPETIEEGFQDTHPTTTNVSQVQQARSSGR